jgi:hypothetical protein
MHIDFIIRIVIYNVYGVPVLLGQANTFIPFYDLSRLRIMLDEPNGE